MYILPSTRIVVKYKNSDSLYYPKFINIIDFLDYNTENGTYNDELLIKSYDFLTDSNFYSLLKFDLETEILPYGVLYNNDHSIELVDNTLIMLEHGDYVYIKDVKKTDTIKNKGCGFKFEYKDYYKVSNKLYLPEYSNIYLDGFIVK